jgi:zinc transporter ZupT
MVFLLAIAVGIYQEMEGRYGEALARGERLPYSVMIYLGLIIAVTVFVVVQTWLPERLGWLYRLRGRSGVIRWIFAILVGLLVSWLFVYSEYSLRFDGFYQRLMLYLSAAYLMAWLASSADDQPFEWSRSLSALILLGCIFAVTFVSQSVVDYPFGLYWSEGNRFYDYSVLFGRRLYDYPQDQPLAAFIDIGRQSLWGLPFLFADISIWTMRLWYQIVFSLPYVLLGWIFIRRKEVGNWPWFLFGLWTFLFLNQGPIYTPLVLAAVLVALTRRAPWWLGFILIAVASYYARVSRFTWLFAPGIWGALIAFLEITPQGIRTTAQRWRRTIIFGCSGLLGGYLIPEILQRMRMGSGDLNVVPTSFDVEGVTQIVGRQPLLWERLWPSETYPLGIVYGLLLAAGPLIVLLIYTIASRRWKLDIWQKLAMGIMFLAFLIVGVIASVKIGGGSNLHNLDMFLIALLFMAGLALESGMKDVIQKSGTLPRWGCVLLLAVIVYPAANNMFTVIPREYPQGEIVEEALVAARDWVAEKKAEGEVLFIDHRQLLTFGFIEDVPLVPDYEKKFMMDLAMADEMEYFDAFYQDLAAHRFSLIISEPLHSGFQEDEHNFGDENNAWVRWVSIPVLCYYEPVVEYPQVGLLVLEPKSKSAPEPDLVCPEY